MLQRIFIISIIISAHTLLIINSQHLPICDSLNQLENVTIDSQNSEVKIRRVRAICDAIYSSQPKSEQHELDAIPDFDLTKIASEHEAEKILTRIRRRGSSGGGRGGGGGRSGGGGRFSSGGSRFSSGGSRFSSGGSRFFGSRSSSSGGSSRIFSRSSPSSGGSRIFSRSSSSPGSSSRIFSRSGSSGSSRIFSRSSSSGSGRVASGGDGSASRTGIRIFSRNPTSSNTGNRVREAIRTMVRKPSSSGTGVVPGAGGTGGFSGHKPSLSDKIRKITGGGSGGGFSSNRYGSGISGFGGAGSGTGGNAWVRAGKKFLPVAVRFGKRYYQRRKYSKGMYAGIGAGTGYYAGSRMAHHGNYYPDNYYGYPPVVDNPPDQVDGQTPTVFYCLQEDLNATLVNNTLDSEGFGTCNVSGVLVKCPIEIECKTSEADNCCEDEQGTPYCCGGDIPKEYSSQYGGYGDDVDDAGDSVNQILNIITTICALLATICFTMWQKQGQ